MSLPIGGSVFTVVSESPVLEVVLSFRSDCSCDSVSISSTGESLHKSSTGSAMSVGSLEVSTKEAERLRCR